jgi:pyridoxine 4-dehydrogenase
MIELCVAQLHWSTQNYQPLQEGALREGIADIYDADLCEAVGISNYGSQQLQKFSERMKERDVPIAIAQVQYSLLTARNNEILDSCNDAGCRLISYSPLCLGLLTGKYDLDNLPRQGNPRRQLFRELLPGAQPLLGTLKAVAKEVGKTPSQVAINWAICKGTVPIPGARNLAQAEENLGAVGWSLSNAAVQELDVASAGVSKKMIENISQTR